MSATLNSAQGEGERDAQSSGRAGRMPTAPATSSWRHTTTIVVTATIAMTRPVEPRKNQNRNVTADNTVARTLPRGEPLRTSHAVMPFTARGMKLKKLATITLAAIDAGESLSKDNANHTMAAAMSPA